MNFPSNIKCYSIVIDGDDRSEYYFNYCKPSWENEGISVEKFKAVVPADIRRKKELRFSKYSSAVKYVKRGIKAEITETEKACFYSHFYLWKESVFLNKPILVLEHDSFLESPNNLWYEDKYGIIFYDKAAMGSYIIHPDIAKKLIDYVYSIYISVGPYALIYFFGVKFGYTDSIVNDRHPKFIPASNQVLSNKYGNTISHYSDGNALFNQHSFIIID